MLKVTLIAVGNKMEAWVNEAVAEYSKRLTKFCQFQLVALPLLKHDIISVIPANSKVIALDVLGKTFSSESLSLHLEKLQLTHPHLCLIIGGPEGLEQKVLDIAHEKWSLSALTLPHTLARVVLVETLYRAFTIIHHHPYHKA